MSPTPEDRALRLREAGLTLTDEDIRRIEARWKSDIEAEVGKVSESMVTVLAFVAECGPWIREAIKRDKAREDFRRSMYEKAASGALLSVILALLLMLWHGFQGEMRKP